MSRGGVPGGSSNKDINAGALRAPACPRHCGGAGEGKYPHPRCARCDMQVPRKALNGLHLGTAQCEKGAERKLSRLAETETRENLERLFHAYGQPMEAVSEFR